MLQALKDKIFDGKAGSSGMNKYEAEEKWITKQVEQKNWLKRRIGYRVDALAVLSPARGERRR